MSLVKRLAALLRGDEGQGLVEYALLVCLIVMVFVGVWVIWRDSITLMVMHIFTYIHASCGCF